MLETKRHLANIGIKENEIIDCIIIYPLKNPNPNLDFKINLKSSEDVGSFVQFKKLGVRIPTINIAK